MRATLATTDERCFL
jgi:ADA HAT complex component 1